MKKRLFGLLVTLCMALGLTPAMPVRAEETHTHCICGASHTVIGDHTDSGEYSGTWTGTATLPTQSGYYYLTDNVTISSTWEPVDGIVLCLNGHTITGTATATGYNGFIELNGDFTLTDCQANEGKIETEAENRACIYSSGNFNLYGGSIEHTNSATGTGVLVSSGKTFNMYGGKITNNSSGGVYNLGTFNMSGGSIIGNAIESFGGGGVSNSGNFYMSGGSITGNTACKGGGVYNSGTFEMSDGTITGNTANTESGKGGGVFNYSGKTFTMSGGKITGNDANDNGGGVYNNGTFKVLSTVVVNNNIINVFSSANNVYLPDSKVITINNALYPGTSIGVTVENPPTEGNSVNITDGADSGNEQYFFSDNTAYETYYDSNKIKLKLKETCSHSGSKVTGQAATCTANGWKDYYQCSKCNKYFSDSACTTSISNLQTWKEGDGKLVAPGHNWTYSANGDTLTASCSRKATCNVADMPLTLTANTVAHTGSSYSGATISNTSAWEGAGLATPTIMYEGTDGTSYESSATAPTAAGRYKATITVNGKTAAAPFSITGDSHTLKVESGANGTAGIEGRPVTTAAIRQYADVTLTATPSTGYQFKQWSISGASITISNNKFIMPDSDVTVTAEFEKISSTGGGSSSGGSSSGGSSSDSSSSGGSSTTPSTDKDKDNGTKTETTTLPDGTKVETTTKTDETTGTTTVEEKKTAPDGTVQSTLVESNAATGEEFTVTKTESKDGQVSSVLATLKTEDATVTKAKADKAEALANMKNIPFRVKVFDENGKLDYKVRVNTADVKADTTLYVYKYDSKTKTYNMVESEYQKISSDDKANIVCDFEKLSVTQRYEFVAQDRAERIDKKILATVKVKTAQKSVKENQSTTFKMDEKLNMENVSSIKYATTDQKIATVSKSGKITAKGSGTVVIKATVTLLNGKTKTVRMTIKVK